MAVRVGIIGCGFMGTAILQGMLNDHRRPGTHFIASVRSEKSAQRLAEATRGHEARVQVVHGPEGVKQAGSEAEVILLGVVPGDLATLVSTPGLIESLRGKTVISLLAGVSVAAVQSSLGAAAGETEVARAIPSLGAGIGQSVTLLADGAPTQVQELLSSIGEVVVVDEGLMDEVTAVGAVCHALIIQAADALVDASVAGGIGRPAAVEVVSKTLKSACGLLDQGRMSPEQIKAAMSTPQGITINALLRLAQNGVPHGIADATRSAVQYAQRMGG